MVKAKKTHVPNKAERALVTKIAAAAHRSLTLHRQLNEPEAINANELLRALESFTSTGPKASKANGTAKRAEFEPVTPRSLYGRDAGVLRADGPCYGRLKGPHPKGKAILAALKKCKQVDEDDAHWTGPFGAELRALVDGRARPNPNLCVMRAVDPFVNPVALLTPVSEPALAAVAACDIGIGMPVALYSGELVADGDTDLPKSTYVYDIGRKQLSARGYPEKVSVNAPLDCRCCSLRVKPVRGHQDWTPYCATCSAWPSRLDSLLCHLLCLAI